MSTKFYSSFLVALLTIGYSGNAQWHYGSAFVSANGDTLNKLDKNGFYDGFYLFSQKNFLNPNVDYLLGNFEHGIPTGMWIDHAKDGSYSIGQYSCGVGFSPDGKGGWIKKKEGIDQKTGVWQYYDKEGKPARTMRYLRSETHKGKLEQTFQQDSAGKFVRIEYKFESRQKKAGVARKMVYKTYTVRGIPLDLKIESSRKTITCSYYPDGKIRLSKVFKQRKFLKRIVTITITKDYHPDGDLKTKTKIRLLKPVDPHPDAC